MKPSPAPLAELKRQLAQIDELMAGGVLAGGEARAQRERLEREILAQVLQPAPAAADSASPRPSRGLVAAVVAFVLVVGVGGYAALGRHDGWNVGPGEPGAASVAAPDAAKVDEMVATLAERMKGRPDDVEGWAMLGRAYTALGRHTEALPAFRHVLELKPGDAQALADVADALATVNNRSLEGEPAALVQQALKADANNVKALALAGTIAFTRDDFKAAVAYWERALQNSKPDDAFARDLQGALDQARQRAGVVAGAAPAAAPASPPPAAATGAEAITGEVRLGAALQSQASPDDVVFIFARAVDGPKMPLAILRLKVRDLPATFKLDDSMAMSPAARLSSSAQVIVGARVSKSGNPIAQPGDLQGFSAPVALGRRDLRLEITETVR